MRATHVAFADESYCSAERYRSIAAVTLARETADVLTSRLFELLNESGLKEFKWSKLRQARERFAALKLVDLVVEAALNRRVRVDVLIWDTEDYRHKIKGRDDQANLQRMYYHLFKNVLHRWPSGTMWALYPDENSALDWATVADFLDAAGFNLKVESSLLSRLPFRARLERDFQIIEVVEVDSTKAPICQVADLFAGLGVFSRKRYFQYCEWLEQQSNQLPLFPTARAKLSNSDKERCTVLKYLDDLCKRHKLGVGLKSSHGLRTYNPANPINFWPYEPQHPEDKAPTKSSET